MNSLFQDLRYGLRQLLKSPGFSAVAVLTLALGIGANTAIFSVVNAVLLRYLPVPNPQQLVYLQTDGMPQAAMESGNPAYTFNLATFQQLQNDRRVFSHLMAFVPLAWGTTPVRIGSEAEEATGDLVSGNFFSGLGVRAERGHTFTSQDEVGHSQTVVLSYNYWTRRFNRDPSVIGQTMYIKSVPFTVVGIAARDFTGVEPDGVATDFWIPFQTDAKLNPRGQGSLYSSPQWWFLMLIGRLQPGISWQQAVAQLNPEFQRAAYEGIGAPHKGERLPQLSFSATGGIEKLRENGDNHFFVPVAMVAVVLLIACVNVGMLLLARNAARQRDFSVRVALGASWLQLFRQLLTEGLLLTLAGTLLAWMFALWTAPVLASWEKLETSVAPDGTVLGLTLTIALGVALMLGLAPLPGAARANVSLALKPIGISGKEGGQLRGSRLLVGLQIALCLVLLVVSGLFVRTLRNLQTTNLGFRASGLLVFGITPPQTLHTPKEDLAFYRTLFDQLRSLPGVESATAMGNRLGAGISNNTDVHVDGAKPDSESEVRWNDVGPDYFHVLGIPLLMGRDFRDADGSAHLAVINKTFADRYLPGRNPVGHQIQIAAMDPLTIIGVAADSRYTQTSESARPMAYVAYSPGGGTMNIALRAYGNPLQLLPQVRRAVAGFSPGIALLQPTTLQAQFDDSYPGEKLFAGIALFFGLLASMLVATGLYGTLAYKVSRRTSEIGVRLALGAQRKEVLWMVMRESLLTSVIGFCIGLPVALLAVRLLRSMLYQLSPFDPMSFALATCGIAMVAGIAGYLPAWRAAKVDPMVALRYE